MGNVNIIEDPGDDYARDLDEAVLEALSFESRQEDTPPKREDKPAAEAPKRGRGRPKGSTNKPKIAPAKLSREVRVQGVQGMVQIAAAGCMLASKSAKKQEVALQADAITLASASEEIASAVADTCAADERFARIVDKICTAGPYAALIQVGFQVGMQIARNHGAPVPGTHSPEELLEMAEAA